MNIFISEWIKTKRTPIRWLVFFIPAIFAALIIWYFSLREITTDSQAAIFRVFFEAWTALAVPFGVGLISALMTYQEELAGNFNGLLGSKLPRRNLYLGKLTMLFLLTSSATLTALLAFLAGLSFILNITLDWPIFVMAALTAVIGTLPLLAFHLWISFAWGMGASIAVGGAGALTASLMAAGLGSEIWQFVPWAWPLYLTSLAGAYLPDMKHSLEITSIGFIAGQAVKDFIPAAVFFLVMLVGGLVWFKRWEGRKISD